MARNPRTWVCLVIRIIIWYVTFYKDVCPRMCRTHNGKTTYLFILYVTSNCVFVFCSRIMLTRVNGSYQGLKHTSHSFFCPFSDYLYTNGKKRDLFFRGTKRCSASGEKQRANAFPRGSASWIWLFDHITSQLSSLLGGTELRTRARSYFL